MIQEIQLRLPAASYHSEETTLARKAASDAVTDVNARVVEYRESVEQLLQADPSTVAPEAVFNGECRLLLFQILQEELNARRLADWFFGLHRRESQNAVVQAAGIACPELIEASDNIACNCWSQNLNRITHLESQLREIIRQQMAI